MLKLIKFRIPQGSNFGLFSVKSGKEFRPVMRGKGIDFGNEYVILGFALFDGLYLAYCDDIGFIELNNDIFAGDIEKFIVSDNSGFWIKFVKITDETTKKTIVIPQKLYGSPMSILNKFGNKNKNQTNYEG